MSETVNKISSLVYTDKNLREAFETYCRTGNGNMLSENMPPRNKHGEEGDNLILLITYMLSVGNADYVSKLGDLYYSGVGVRTDMERAQAFFSEARQMGSKRADYDLGWIYYDNKEYAKCIDAFSAYISNAEDRPAAFIGAAYRLMGKSYLKQAEPDLRKAIECLTTAGEKYDDPDVYYSLYKIYANPENKGIFNAEAALSYLERGIAAGDLQCGVCLAHHYLFGEKSLSVDPDEGRALKILQQFDSSEDRLILRYTGYLYFVGSRDKTTVPPDYEKAIRYLQKTYDLYKENLVLAFLGRAYLIQGDYDNAFHYLTLAVDNGDNSVAAILAGLWKDGNGTFSSAEKALHYFNLAYKAKAPISSFGYSEYLELLQNKEMYDLAVEVAQTALEQYNDIEFCFIIGKIVLSGKSTRISTEEAAKLMEESMAYEYYENEASMYLGIYNMRINSYSSALKLLNKAYSSGIYDAGVYIGRIYEKGGGIIQPDIKIAYDWYSKAAAAGSKMAIQELSCFKPTLFGKYKRIKN